MKYYTSTTKYNCGIDLHARQMYVCVMDRQGKKLVLTIPTQTIFHFEWIARGLTVECFWTVPWHWITELESQSRSAILNSGWLERVRIGV